MKPIYLLLLITIISYSGITNAGSQTGYIKHLLVHYDGTVNRINVDIEGPASTTNCSYNGWTAYLDYPSAKAQYSMLLAAQLASKKVTVMGASNSVCIGDRERIRNTLIVD